MSALGALCLPLHSIHLAWHIIFMDNRSRIFYNDVRW